MWSYYGENTRIDKNDIHQSLRKVLFGDDTNAMKMFLQDQINDAYSRNKYQGCGFVGRSPLCHAIIKERIDVIDFLIAHGADVNHEDWDDIPLEYACSKKGPLQYDIIQRLLNAGADPNKQDFRGETPLFSLMRNYYDSSVIYLMYTHGANFDVDGENGNSLLMNVNEENTESFEILLDISSTINKQNNEGNTILHILSSRDLLIHLKLVLKRNPDLYIKNNEGHTCFDIAVGECKKYLISMYK